MSDDGERARFEQAAEYIRRDTTLNLSNEQKLQLYSYFKQVRRPAGHTHANYTTLLRLTRASVAQRSLGSLISLAEPSGTCVSLCVC